MKYVVALCMAVFGSMCINTVASAEQSKFKQQILPMDCVFEIIDFGTGEIRFLTPDECGVVLPPEPTSTNGTNHQTQNKANAPTFINRSLVSVSSIENISGDLQLGKAINLDRYEKFRSSHGQFISVRVGQTYYFRTKSIGSAQIITTVYVAKISNAGVTLVVNDEAARNLPLGRTRALDVDQDGITDFFIAVKSIDSDSTATMYFRYFQTDNNFAADGVANKDSAQISLVIWGIVVTASSIWFIRRTALYSVSKE